MSVARSLPSRGGDGVASKIQIQQESKKVTTLSGRRALLEQLYSMFFQVLKAATYLIILTYDFPYNFVPLNRSGQVWHQNDQLLVKVKRQQRTIAQCTFFTKRRTQLNKSIWCICYVLLHYIRSPYFPQGSKKHHFVGSTVSGTKLDHPTFSYKTNKQTSIRNLNQRAWNCYILQDLKTNFLNLLQIWPASV